MNSIQVELKLVLCVNGIDNKNNFIKPCSKTGVNNSNLMIGQKKFWHIQGPKFISINTFKRCFLNQSKQKLGCVGNIKSFRGLKRYDVNIKHFKYIQFHLVKLNEICKNLKS